MTADTPEYRALVIQRFVLVASTCLQLNNFNGVMEVLSGLQAPSVSRLSQTWKLVSGDATKAFKHLVEILSLDPKNVVKFRQRMREAAPPVSILDVISLCLANLNVRLCFVGDSLFGHLRARTGVDRRLGTDVLRRRAHQSRKATVETASSPHGAGAANRKSRSAAQSGRVGVCAGVCAHTNQRNALGPASVDGVERWRVDGSEFAPRSARRRGGAGRGRGGPASAGASFN